LRKEFIEEFTRLTPGEIKANIIDLKGEKYQEIYNKIRKIVSHQFKQNIENGIKGFILYGDVGTGKTTMAKALAKDLSVPLFYIDGSDIARSRYGHSEQQIASIFENASKEKSIVLIDDAESVFPSRDWQKGESWHIAQNNVFFHKLDNVDSARLIVIITTNRYDLLDKAIKDRLYSIEVPQPDIPTLVEIAKMRCLELGIPTEEIIKAISQEKNNFTSVRSVEKLVILKYIEHI
jgi:SpoVK/Ycf46/Vps4 family AAA+-type ATPase